MAEAEAALATRWAGGSGLQPRRQRVDRIAQGCLNMLKNARGDIERGTHFFDHAIQRTRIASRPLCVAIQLYSAIQYTAIRYLSYLLSTSNATPL